MRKNLGSHTSGHAEKAMFPVGMEAVTVKRLSENEPRLRLAGNTCYAIDRAKWIFESPNRTLQPSLGPI